MTDTRATRGAEDSEPDAPPPTGGAMSLMQHLDELRKRLVRIAIGVAAGFFLCWWQADLLMEWCQAPYRAVANHPLAVMAVAEAFFVKVHVAFGAALFLTAPWIAYQAWMFVSPGLYPRERRLAVPFIVLVSFFFLCGGAFGYFVGLPAMLDFLLKKAAVGFDVQVRAESYVSTFIRLIVGMGLVFEAPVLAALLARMGLLSAGFLIRKLRISIVVIAVLAAFITPSGDIPTMLVFAVPMLVLYLLSIGVAWVFARKEPAS
jgi:sec-independent protein translocase protein TatC